MKEFRIESAQPYIGFVFNEFLLSL